MIKNTFYFILKALSFLRYLSFCHDFLVMLKKQFGWEDKVNFTIMTSQTGYWLTNSYNTHIAQYLPKQR